MANLMVSVIGPWFIPLLAGEPQNQDFNFFVMYILCRSHTMHIHMTAMNKTQLTICVFDSKGVKGTSELLMHIAGSVKLKR